MTADDFPGFEADDDTRIWRYFRNERLADLLSGSLYFAAARQFEDDFEGALTAAAHARRVQSVPSFLSPDERVRHEQNLSRAFEDLRRMTKINCWHARAHENVSMWERYCPQGGVAVRSTVGRLKRALNEFRLDPEYGAERIVIGRVRYLDYETDSFVDGSMLGLFLHKRSAFEDESEIRAVLSLRFAAEYGVTIPDGGVRVGVDLPDLIDEVRVGPYEDNEAVVRVRSQLHAIGLKCEVRPSELSDRPTY